jgi:hypothetical protein
MRTFTMVLGPTQPVKWVQGALSWGRVGGETEHSFHPVGRSRMVKLHSSPICLHDTVLNYISTSDNFTFYITTAAVSSSGVIHSSSTFSIYSDLAEFKSQMGRGSGTI